MGKQKTYSGYSKDSYNNEATMTVRKQYSNAPQTVTEKVSDVERFGMIAVPFRGITEEAAQYFGIRSSVSPADGITITATYYPYYDKHGKLTGYKKRDWTLQKEEKGHITTVGVLKITNQLFGQKQVDAGNTRKRLVQLEGEDNVINTWQAILDNARQQLKNPNIKREIANYYQKLIDAATNPGYDLTNQPVIPVVGLSLGCANAREAIANNEHFVRSFESYILALDNDKATETEALRGIKKGVEATDDIATFLLSEKVFVVQWPDAVNDPHGLNDPREFVNAGRSNELVNLVTKCKTTYVPDKVVGLEDFTIDSLRKKGKDGIPLPMFPGLYAKTRGPRTGELWVATGPSGSGKTTVSRRIEYAIAHYLMQDEETGTFLPDWTSHEKMGIIHLEEDSEESINSLYAIELGIDEKEFVADPSAFLTEEQHLTIHNKWKEKDKVKVFKHFGSIPVSQLIEKLKHMVFIDKVRWIILDHLSIVISGLGVADERKELDMAMTALAAFCKQYDVFILAISHLKRTDFQAPKVKDGEDPLPFFVPVRKEQLRGSASLEQLAWIIFAVEPEELPNRERGRVRTVILKNRPHKKLGVADTLWMGKDGKFEDAGRWEWDAGCFKQDGVIKYLPSLEAVPQEQMIQSTIISQTEDAEPDIMFDEEGNPYRNFGSDNSLPPQDLPTVESYEGDQSYGTDFDDAPF